MRPAKKRNPDKMLRTSERDLLIRRSERWECNISLRKSKTDPRSGRVRCTPPATAQTSHLRQAATWRYNVPDAEPANTRAMWSCACELDRIARPNSVSSPSCMTMSAQEACNVATLEASRSAVEVGRGRLAEARPRETGADAGPNTKGWPDGGPDARLAAGADTCTPGECSAERGGGPTDRMGRGRLRGQGRGSGRGNAGAGGGAAGRQATGKLRGGQQGVGPGRGKGKGARVGARRGVWARNRDPGHTGKPTIRTGSECTLTGARTRGQRGGPKDRPGGTWNPAASGLRS